MEIAIRSTHERFRETFLACDASGAWSVLLGRFLFLTSQRSLTYQYLLILLFVNAIITAGHVCSSNDLRFVTLNIDV